MIKRGIFGGTFDPIHGGHLKIAQAALRIHGLQEIVWVPQLVPPRKIPRTTIEQRWSMVELAIAPCSQFCLPATLDQWQSNFLPHADYAIDTFFLLQELHLASRWFWILGVDSFLTLPRWKGREMLIPRCTWLVAARNLPPMDQRDQLNQRDQRDQLNQLNQVTTELQSQGIAITWEILPLEAIDISSSIVRQACRAGQSLDHLLPVPVQEYISQHHLYLS